MPFLYDEAFDYNELVTQNRALVRNFPQKTKASPELPTADGNGFVIDNTAAGLPVGAGFMYSAALLAVSAPGTIVATCVVGGSNVAQVGVGNAVEGLATVDLNETGSYIEDNNGASSTDFVLAGFVVGQVVKVNGATASNSLKWNGYYRIASITSNGGGTNNRLNLTAADIVSTPGDHSAQSGLILTPIGAGAYFTLSGTAGLVGLLVCGQRYTRSGYHVVIRRTTADFSAAGNADRLTMTMGDGGFTAKHVYSPTTVDFDTTADTIVDDDGGDFEALGFRIGAGVMVRNAAVGANDGLAVITNIDDLGATRDRLTVSKNLTTSANDAGAELIPMNAGPVLALEVDISAANSSMQRTDLQPWTSDGIFPGDWVITADAVAGGNNGPFLVTDIVTTTQRNDTLILAGSLVDATADAITLTVYFVPERFGDQKYSWDRGQVATDLRDAPPITGEEPPLEDVDGNFGQQWNWEAPAILFGADVASRIFGGAFIEFDEGATRYNMRIQGADGFVASSVFLSQPNAPWKMLHLETNAFPFAVACNGEHLRGFARVLGSVDQPWYIGFGELQAARGQHPYPMLVGAASPDPTYIPSTVASDHRAWWDPASSGTIDDPSSAVFQQVDGTYKNIIHSTSTSTYNPGLTKQQWFTPYVNQRSGALTQPEFYWQGLTNVLRRGLGDEYDLIPLELFNENPDAAYIKPYGVAFVSGEANAGLNTTLINGVTWVVTQNISLTGNRNYAAFALE